MNSENQKNQINAESTLGEILKIEGSEEILNKYNVPCLSCPMMSMEMNSLTLGQVAKMYDIDMEGVLEELNRLLNSQGSN